MSHDEAKDRLIGAAGPLFAERGYEAATVREICKAAGVNLASVNYYFGDKQRLYVETVNAAHRASTGQVAFSDLEVARPPEEALRHLIFLLAQHLLRSDAKPWQLRLIMREVMQPTEAGRAMVEQAFRPFFARLLQVIGELVPADTPLYRKEFMAFSIVGQCVYHRNARDVISQLTTPEHVRKYFTPESLAEHVYRFSLAGVRSWAYSGGRSEAEPVPQPGADLAKARKATQVRT